MQQNGHGQQTAPVPAPTSAPAAASPGEVRFDQPHRTWWMKGINNLAGGAAKVGLKTKLTKEWLFRHTWYRTWSNDFGEKNFHEPLEILLDSLDREAHLSPFGRVFFREELMQRLKNRLAIQKALKKNPEIRNEPVRKPLFVVGLPRTGTTLLYNLLCQDPHSRPLMIWETFYPGSDPLLHGRRRDPRRKKVRMLLKLVDKMVPSMKAIHPMSPDAPEECTWLLANTFVSPGYSLSGYNPSYMNWLYGLTTDQLGWVYREYREQLQIIQWGGDPSKHWVTKSPVHMFGLEAMLREFPDGHILQTHRDPQKVIPSACSLYAASMGRFTDKMDEIAKHGPELIRDTAMLMERSIKPREQYGDRIHDVHYSALVKDPIGTVRAIYQQIGYPYDDRMDENIRNWMASNPQNKHGVHKYELEKFHLTREMIDDMFANYCKQFHVEPEAARA